MKRLLILMLCAKVSCGFGQIFLDSFNTGLSNKWLFNSGDFIPDNGGMRSNRSTGNAEIFDASVLCNSASAEVWTMNTIFAFNPSSQNFLEFYLASDTFPTKIQNGYVVRIGHTNDNLVLFKISNGLSTALITSATGIFNKTSNELYLKINRDLNNNWELRYKEKISDTFNLVGIANDPSFVGGKYIGFKITQTTTNAKKHFFDDVYIGKEIKDTSGPKMLAATLFMPDSLEIEFNEPLKAIDKSQFSIASNTVLNAQFLSNSKSKVGLRFSNNFISGNNYSIENQGTPDVLGNLSKKHNLVFKALKIDTALKNDLIFTEVMAIPDPVVAALPAGAEYVELYNRTNKYIRTGNLKFGDASSSYVLPDSIIPPYSFVTLSKNTFTDFKNYGRWIGLSTFPSLNNDGDILKLGSATTGTVLQELDYRNTWHTDALKGSGGWSLELIDTTFFCIEEGNWKSNTSVGGTPGQLNSIASKLNLTIEPLILSALAIEPNKIKITLNQNPDSATAVKLSNYTLKLANSNLINPIAVENFTKSPFAFNLIFNAANLKVNELATLNVSGLATCYGKAFNNIEFPIGIPDTGFIDGELLINEILFDPKLHNDDYVELYNKGNRILDLKNLMLCSLDEKGSIIKAVPVSDESRPLLPNQYVLLTTSSANIENQYLTKNLSAFLELKEMPTFANDKGNVLITNRIGRTIDYFEYKDNMHFEIIKDVEGISLERINPNAPTLLNSNWASATQASGFGTPGMQNSVYQKSTKLENNKYFSFDKAYCSPNNDGFEDQLILNYNLPSSAYSATARIFTDNGIEMCMPLNNYILNINGQLVLDIRCNNANLNPGNYVLVIDAWSADGHNSKQKLTFSILN